MQREVARAATFCMAIVDGGAAEANLKKKRFQNKTKKTKRKRRRLSAASTTAELTEGITVNKNDNNSSVEEEFSHKKTFTAAWRWQHCSKVERKASVH